MTLTDFDVSLFYSYFPNASESFCAEKNKSNLPPQEAKKSSSSGFEHHKEFVRFFS